MADAERPVSRLPALTNPDADPILGEMFRRILTHRPRVLNIHRTVGHAPKMLRAQASYAGSMRDESSLPRDFQEVIILRVAQINNSEYEQSAHRPIAKGLGVSAEKIAALPSWRDSKLFSTRERAALAYVEQAASSNGVDDATFDATRAEFSPQEIVEMTALVAWYTGNARFVRALRIEPEPQ